MGWKQRVIGDQRKRFVEAHRGYIEQNGWKEEIEYLKEKLHTAKQQGMINEQEYKVKEFMKSLSGNDQNSLTPISDLVDVVDSLLTESDSYDDDDDFKLY